MENKFLNSKEMQENEQLCLDLQILEYGETIDAMDEKYQQFEFSSECIKEEEKKSDHNYQGGETVGKQVQFENVWLRGVSNVTSNSYQELNEEMVVQDLCDEAQLSENKQTDEFEQYQTFEQEKIKQNEQYNSENTANVNHTTQYYGQEVYGYYSNQYEQIPAMVPEGYQAVPAYVLTPIQPIMVPLPYASAYYPQGQATIFYNGGQFIGNGVNVPLGMNNSTGNIYSNYYEHYNQYQGNGDQVNMFQDNTACNSEFEQTHVEEKYEQMVPSVDTFHLKETTVETSAKNLDEAMSVVEGEKVNQVKKVEKTKQLDETKNTDVAKQIDKIKNTDPIKQLNETKNTDEVKRLDETKNASEGKPIEVIQKSNKEKKELKIKEIVVDDKQKEVKSLLENEQQVTSEVAKNDNEQSVNSIQSETKEMNREAFKTTTSTENEETNSLEKQFSSDYKNDLTLMIGKHYPKYIDKIFKMEQTQQLINFNVFALLFGPLWYMYRKMIIPSILITSIGGLALATSYTIEIIGVLAVFNLLFADRLYKLSIESKLDTYYVLEGEKRDSYVSLHSGASVIGTMVYVLIALLLVIAAVEYVAPVNNIVAQVIVELRDLLAQVRAVKL